MDGIRVRRPAPQDAAGIARTHVQAWKAGYRDLMPRPFLDRLDEDERAGAWEQRLIARDRSDDGDEPEFLLAERVPDGAGAAEVVGVATIGPERPAPGEVDGVAGPSRAKPPVGEVWMVNVLPSAWADGVGSALLTAATERLRGLGYRSLVLWVLEDNDRARRFYERNGWEPDGGTKTEVFGGRPLRELRYTRR